MELKEIGKKEGGTLTEDMITKVMDAVTDAAWKADGSPGIGESKKPFSGFTSGEIYSIKKAVEGATGTLKMPFGN